jgi:Holliday junction resolvasome RuvABC endonuclease subunit
VRIAGIDLSSFAIDIVLIPQVGEGKFQWIHVDLGKKGDAFDRSRLVRDAMPARTHEIWDDVNGIGIEEPFGKGQLSTAAVYRVQGAVIGCLPTKTLLHPWAPATWKQRIGIGGNANKMDILTWAVHRENRQRRSWGYPQDVADALGIAVATQGAISASRPTPRRLG